MGVHGMSDSWIWKGLGGLVAGLVATLAPTPILMTLYECLMAMTVIDSITGIQAAKHRKERICPSAFISKYGRKLVRQVTYLGIAWVLGQMLKSGIAINASGPVTEPMAMVLGALIVADIISSLRNLSGAKNNHPVIDRFIRRIARMFEFEDEDPKRKNKETP